MKQIEEIEINIKGLDENTTIQDLIKMEKELSE